MKKWQNRPNQVRNVWSMYTQGAAPGIYDGWVGIVVECLSLQRDQGKEKMMFAVRLK